MSQAWSPVQTAPWSLTAVSSSGGPDDARPGNRLAASEDCAGIGYSGINAGCVVSQLARLLHSPHFESYRTNRRRMSTLGRYKRIWEKRRLLDRLQRAFSHPRKEKQVGKMQDSEDYEHHSDLVAEQHDGFAQAGHA